MTGPQDGGIWLPLRHSLAEIQDKKDFYKERSQISLSLPQVVTNTKARYTPSSLTLSL